MRCSKLPVGDIDIATTALPDEVIRRAQGRRHQERADRHRARHGDAGRRQAAVRGHDAARGHRDVRPQGKGRVRPRLGARRRAARFHHQRPFRRCRRRGARLCRRACRYRRAARALHRRGRASASPKIICASCASSASTPPMARASRTAPDYLACIAGRAGLATLSAERVRMEMLKLMVADGAAAGRRRDGRWRPAAARSSAASPIPGRSPR